MDWRIFAIGVGMLIPGIALSIIVNQNLFSAGGSYMSTIPSLGYENKFLSYPELGRIGAIIGAIGSLLALVSFGLGRRKRRSGEGMRDYSSDEPS
jgi:hypothetical protein